MNNFNFNVSRQQQTPNIKWDPFYYFNTNYVEQFDESGFVCLFICLFLLSNFILLFVKCQCKNVIMIGTKNTLLIHEITKQTHTHTHTFISFICCVVNLKIVINNIYLPDTHGQLHIYNKNHFEHQVLITLFL